MTKTPISLVEYCALRTQGREVIVTYPGDAPIWVWRCQSENYRPLSYDDYCIALKNSR